jgi:toxin ParE1/3/4
LYTDKIRAACQKLAEKPHLGRNYDRVPRKYFGHREGRHNIFYRMVSSDEIVIVRILHVGMDLKYRMGE